MVIFSCSSNQLTSLEGCPTSVGGKLHDEFSCGRRMQTPFAAALYKDGKRVDAKLAVAATTQELAVKQIKTVITSNTDSDTLRSLFCAIKRGSVEAVAEIIKANPAIMDEVDVTVGISPKEYAEFVLHRASKCVSALNEPVVPIFAGN